MTAQVPPLTSPYGNFLLGSARPQLCPALPTPGDAAPLTLPAGRRSSWQGGGLPMAAHSSRPALSASATKQNGPIALFESFREDEKDLVFFFLTQSYRFVFFSSALIPPHQSPATCTHPPQACPCYLPGLHSYPFAFLTVPLDVAGSPCLHRCSVCNLYPK